jgi:hypothetical protein
MAEKTDTSPQLKLVSSPPNDGKPAAKATRSTRKLGKHGQALWDKLKTTYKVTKKADVETLRLVCEAQDRLCAIEVQIQLDGLMVMGRNGAREHPLLRSEVSLRSFITRYLRQLVNPDEPRRGPGRPGSGGIGLTWQQMQQLDYDDDGNDEVGGAEGDAGGEGEP